MAARLLFLCVVSIFLNMVSAFPEKNTFRPNQLGRLYTQLQQLYPQLIQGRIDLWKVGMMAVVVCSLIPGFWYLKRISERKPLVSRESEKSEKGVNATGARKSIDINDAEAIDPGLLKKHSEIRSFTTSRYTYPSLRVFYRKHPQAGKLPNLPLLCFIHGLGGSSSQFHSLLTSMVNLASCISIDLPGCGLSTFEPTSWDAYKTESLAELLGLIIEEYREKDSGQGVVLIGHSMGCSFSALLASKTSPHFCSISEHVVGLVAVCPKADPPPEPQVATFRKLLWVPNLVFDTWRKWDRRGGINSPSVVRFVGADADKETRKLQERFNTQSRTAVWRRMVSGSLPKYDNGIAKGGLPGGEVWAGLECPVFLVAGEIDNITKPVELEKIAAFLGKSHPIQIELDEDSLPIVESANETWPARSRSDGIKSLQEKDFDANPDTVKDALEDPSTPNEGLSIVPPQSSKPRRVLKTTILPAPASHALLYMPSTVRVLSGLISDFLQSQVSARLNLGWQLQYLSTAGKWDVKNLAKWQAVAPVSEPIADVFRAMKTLREVDENHCPEMFVKDWGLQIKDIVDISHESPVYDPRGLEKGGIRYHKFPTVSKIPPTGEEVDVFMALIDRLREEQKVRAEKEGWTSEHFIGVHCHYGFNRTGYFTVCYLVERCGYTVQGAIDEFATKRPKGIKHAHFLDQLFVRYCVGLKRAPTL